ncbi:MAG TPA: hypothetical protein VHH88_06685, partial [Verrucomicrobiae bacterium]|nr:hypothetical protein [Verrucomicrobiae bacterium]
MFLSCRFVMVEVFWLNIMLLAVATGEKLFSTRGLLALLLAATLAPMWDYGFEVRHDNILLTGILVLWCCIRVGKPNRRFYFIAGAISSLLQFIAFKAFVFTIPICLLMVVFPRQPLKTSRVRLGLLWAVGAASALLVVRLIYGFSGVWDIYLNGFRWVAGVSASGSRFGAWFPLERLLDQTPLLLALLAASCFSCLYALRLCRRGVVFWDSLFPEVLLFSIGLSALLINPTPFPYNLVNFVPFAFLLAYKFGRNFWSDYGQERGAMSLLTG